MTLSLGNDGEVRTRQKARRVWSAPLWGHALALALLLFVLMPVIGSYWQWSADEGAVLFQSDQLARGEGWLTPGSAARRRSRRGMVPDPPVRAGLERRVGGLRQASGVSDAALGTARSGRDHRRGGPRHRRRRWSPHGARERSPKNSGRGTGRASLWALGLATPLLFYSYSVIAHTLGAAGVGLAALGVLRWTDGRSRWLARADGGECDLVVACATRPCSWWPPPWWCWSAVAWRRRDQRAYVSALVIGGTGLACSD